MTLQAKLTLGSVLLATLIVTLVSGVDLANFMQLQFSSMLERGELVRDVATLAVKDSLNRPRQPSSLREALRDPVLRERLLKLIGQSKALSEIALVSAVDSEEVLASTTIIHNGQPSVPVPDFGKFVKTSSFMDRLRVIINKEPVYFKLDEDMGSGGQVLFKLRLILNPSLLRNQLTPSINRSLRIAILSVAGAVALTFFFSTVAFRTLVKIGRMLDLV